MSMMQMYKNMLATAWSAVDEDGTIQTKATMGDNTTVKRPMQIEGKNAVLPTQQNLSNLNPDTMIVFHPLNENPIKGESAVLARLRSAISVRVNWALGTVLVGLLALANSKDQHRKLSPEQSELLSVLKDVSDSTMESFSRLLTAAITANPSGAIVKFYLRRGGKLGDSTYSRCSMVNFPLYEDLVTGKDSRIYKKDTAILLKLFEFVFPNIAKPEAYSVGSDSTVAPYTEAFFRSLVEVIGAINTVVDTYGEFIPDSELARIEADWAIELPNLPDMVKEIRMVPRQAGSDGSEKRSDAATQTMAISNSPIQRSEGGRQPAENTQLTTVTASAPTTTAAAPVKAANGFRALSYDELLEQRRQQSMQPQQQQFNQFQQRQQGVVNTAWPGGVNFQPTNRDGTGRGSNTMMNNNQGGIGVLNVGGIGSFNGGGMSGGFRNHHGTSI